MENELRCRQRENGLQCQQKEIELRCHQREIELRCQKRENELRCRDKENILQCKQRENEVQCGQRKNICNRKKVTFAPEDRLNTIHVIQSDKEGVTGRNHKRIRRKCNKTIHHINLLYCNINGARGKIRSLKDVISMEETDVVLITETKGRPPLLEGFTWYSKERQGGRGGGVAIAVRNNLNKYVIQPNINECSEMEIIWIAIKRPHESTIYLGCYYGLQEKSGIDKVERQYEHLKTQVAMVSHKGKVVLAGDFNSKVQIDETYCKQSQSRNGKIMESFLQETGLEHVNTTSMTGVWTRVNRNNPEEKSIIDYILVNHEGKGSIYDLDIDEHGSKRLKNPRSESDHNTITAKLRTTRITMEKKTVSRWKINDQTDWRKYNQLLEENLELTDRTYEMVETAITKALKDSVGKVTLSIGNNRKPRENKQIKLLRKWKKEKKRNLEKANQENKKNALEEYYSSQRELRAAIEEVEKRELKGPLMRSVIIRIRITSGKSGKDY